MPTTISRTTRRRRRNGKRQDTTKAEVSKFAGDAYDLGRRALRGVVYLKNLINIEVKFADNQANTTPDTTGAVALVQSIAQDDTVSGRSGNSVKLQSVSFKFHITRHASATSTLWRVILFRDNERTTIDPTVAKLLADTTAGVAHLSPYTWNAVQSQRFGILADYSGVLDANNLTTIESLDIPHSGHIKYTGANATDNAEGSLFVLYISSEATNKPAMSWKARVTFTDD